MTQALLSGAAIGAMYVLMSLGFALALEIADIVNAAHGAFVVGGMYVTLEIVDLGASPYVAAVGAALIWGAIAYPLYVFIIRPAKAESGHRVQLVFTLLLFSALVAAYQLLFGADLLSLGQRSKAVDLPGGYLTVFQIVALAIAISASLLLYAIARWTMLGKLAYVASKYPLGAKSIGVPVERIYAGVFVLGSALAGLAGGVLVTFQPVEPTSALQYTIVVFLVALVARTNLLACLVLGLVYGIVQAFLAYTVDASFAATLTLVIFLVALVSEQVLRRVGSIYSRLTVRASTPTGVIS